MTSPSNKKPNQGSENTSSDNSLLAKAEMFLDKKEYSASLAILRSYWLDHPYEIKPAQLLSRLTRETGQEELSECLERLTVNEEVIKFDPQALFDAGFKLLDARLADLAAMLLARVLDLVENEPTVHYELGFALMQMQQWEKAIPHFQKAAEDGDDFDTRLNLAVCYTLLRKAAKAADMIGGMSELSDKPEHDKELVHRRIVLKRLAQFEKKTTLSNRDWLYILYGTLLINNTFASSALPQNSQALIEYQAIASTLLILRGVLDAFGLDFDVVEYYNPVSRPMAEAMARLMDVAAEPYIGPEREDRALLIMTWATDVIGPHQSFVPLSRKRTIFSYGLSSTEPLPVVPDIVGCLSQECIMPWAQQLNSLERNILIRDDGLPNEVQRAATDQIIQKTVDIESQPRLIQTIQEITDYYENKKELLIVGNSEIFTERPDYTAEIPV